MRRNSWTLAVQLALVCVAVPAYAGWQVFLPSDGLLNGRVQDLDVAPDGSVWFHTMRGVSRYDGLTWTNYPDKCGLLGCILADRQGNIWVDGHWKFDGHQWTEISTAGQISRSNQMMVAADGSLWVAEARGAYRFDGAEWVQYRRDNGQYEDRHYCVLQDRHGAIWFGTDTGLRRFQDGIWTDITTAGDRNLGKVQSIFEDRQGALWLGTIPIMRFDGETWTSFGTTDTPPWAGTYPSTWSTAPSRIAEDREGNLWMSIYGTGVARYRDGVWKIYRDSDDPRMIALTDLAIDGHDNVWVATTLGPVRFDGEDWDYLQPGIEAGANVVTSILEERPGVWWIGTIRGLYRYENGAYTVYTSASGLLTDLVNCLARGSDGVLWVGHETGLSVFDGTAWTTRTTTDTVWDILRHSSGDMYLGTDGGLIRIHGSEWTTFNMESGLPGNAIYSVAEDDAGRVWVTAYGHGTGRFDGQAWQWFLPEDGLPSQNLYKVKRGVGHDMWVCGASGGVGRFDGAGWTSYGVDDGLGDASNFALLVDRAGVVWVASSEGAIVSRFDGTAWKSLGLLDGLQGSRTRTLMEDFAGHLWIGSENGVAILDGDRVAPMTFFAPRPPRVSPSRRQILPIVPAWGETKGILYSYSLDGEPWSTWTTGATWVVPDLADGIHDLRARTRDSWGNVDPDPAHAVIEIDATPPEPIMTTFAGGKAVRGEVSVDGTADDPRLDSWRLLVRPAGAGSWEPPAAAMLASSRNPVGDGELARWNTARVPDGDYELRLEEADTLGLVGVALSRVVVDNVAPWADESSPALVSSASGGNVYTTDGAAHLYFAPHAFAGDEVVTVTALSPADVPDSLAGGAMRIHPGYEIGWSDTELGKPASLRLGLGASVAPPNRPMAARSGPEAGLRPALYRSSNDSDWERIGGTLDPSAGTLSAVITRPGRYAVFADAGIADGRASLSGITVTPRVFSPTGGFSSTEIAISFSMGRSGAATVRVYNRAGRLVRELLSGSELSAGVNVLRWNGRDDSGALVPDDLYLVSVEAGSERRQATLSVVR